MQSATGRFGRLLAIRMAPGEDILESLDNACEKAGIKHGVIVSGIGSMNGASFFNPVPLKDKKAGFGYSDAIILRGAIELVSMNGMICEGDDGKRLFHVHCSFSDQYGNGWGGHLIEGNRVLLTVDVIVAEIDDLFMGRRYDEDLEVFIFNPTERERNG